MRHKLNGRKIITLIVFLVILSCMILSGCSDEDWAPYEEKTEEVSIKLDNSICDLVQCKEELKNVCNKYAKDLLLVHAEYKFFKDKDSQAIISMSKVYERGEVGYTKLCELYVDIESNTVTKIIYCDGISRRVDPYGPELDGIIANRADKLYDDYMKDKEYMDKLHISYYYNEINIGGYDKTEKRILKKTLGIQ